MIDSTRPQTKTSDNPDYMRDYMSERRAKGREIEVGKPADLEARTVAESDPYRWLKRYFSERFYNPFTDNQRAIVDAVTYRVINGGDQAIAAPRGDGKTTIVECLSLYLMLTGRIKFLVIVAANAHRATLILSNIKAELEDNELLCADYPEAADPVAALERSPIRAKKQTYNGKYTNIRWEKDIVRLAAIPNAACSGAILSTVGIDGAIRGIRLGAQRPDFVLLDDIETRDSVNSATQTATREHKIEQDIGGLSGPGQSITKVLLCTIMSPYSLAAKYTDRKQKPAWSGERHRLIDSWPDNLDHWKRYIHLRQTGQESGEDPDGRTAHGYYLDNRKEMDAGASISNPYRHITHKLDDGSERESSTLEHCYNIISDRGEIPFRTEYQNDPPKEDENEGDSLSSRLVSSRLSRLERGTVPVGTVCITRAIDVGQYRCHWATIAWKAGAAGYVIDYGIQEVPRKRGVTVEDAILRALREFRDTSPDYVTEEGEAVQIDRTLVDAGHWNQVIFGFCRESDNRYVPSMGVARWRYPSEKKQSRVHHECYESYSPRGKQWVLNINTDYWKEWVHERFNTEAAQSDRGTLQLWGEDPLAHRDAENGNFARQIVAEVYRTEFKEGTTGLKGSWYKVHKDNHYLDAVCYASCVAGVLGIQLLGKEKPKWQRKREQQVKQKRRRKSTGSPSNPWVNRR